MLKPIVLVEDNPKDLEFTLVVLGKTHLANEVVVLRDGAEVLDYLTCAGAFATASGNPAVVLLDLKLPKVDGIQVLEAIKGNPELQSMIQFCGESATSMTSICERGIMRSRAREARKPVARLRSSRARRRRGGRARARGAVPAAIPHGFPACWENK